MGKVHKRININVSLDTLLKAFLLMIIFVVSSSCNLFACEVATPPHVNSDNIITYNSDNPQTSFRWLYDKEASFSSEEDNPYLVFHVQSSDDEGKSWTENSIVRIPRLFNFNKNRWIIERNPNSSLSAAENLIWRWLIERDSSEDNKQASPIIIHVQASRNEGLTWIDDFIIKIPRTVKPDGSKFAVSLTPSYSIGYYDFYNGHNTDGPRVQTTTDYGFGCTVDFSFKPSNNIRTFIEFGGNLERKKKDHIMYPQGFSMYYLRASLGLDFVEPVISRFSFYVGASAGYMYNFYAYGRTENSKKTILYTPTPVFGARAGLDFEVLKHLSVGIRSGIQVAYLNSSDMYYKSFTYLIDPIGLSMEFRF